jgi:hypothetical protein
MQRLVLHVGFSLSATKNLPIRKTGLPKREKPAKRNESSSSSSSTTMKNKKYNATNKKKGIAVHSQSQRY